MAGTDEFTLESLDAELVKPENRENPYAFYRELRERQPRCRVTSFDAWVLTTHADVEGALRDARLSSSNRHQPGYEGFVELARQAGLGAVAGFADEIMLFMDPPDHTRLRRLVVKAFTPRAVERMRPHVAELVAGMLDGAEAAGRIDVIPDLAYPLPVTVIGEMLGVPREDHAQFREWTAAIVKLLDPGDDFSIFPAAGAALQEVVAYFDGLIETRRREPRDDLLSALLAVEEEGDRLTAQELSGTMILLFIAGFETTVNLIGNGMLALLDHPDEHRRLQDDPSLTAGAVEEMLRYDSPVQLTGRHPVGDLSFGGLDLTRGQQVVLILGAANRDPAQFPDPDRFDIARPPGHHVAFGGGIHLCVGAPLARLEAQEAVGALVRRFPKLHVDGEPRRRPTVTLRGLESLPLSW